MSSRIPADTISRRVFRSATVPLRLTRFWSWLPAQSNPAAHVPAVSGTNANLESVPIRIQSPITDVPDLSIGNAGKGGLLQIQFKGFNSALTGGGSDADVTGTDFVVTLYDSNSNVVGTVTVSP